MSLVYSQTLEGKAVLLFTANATINVAATMDGNGAVTTNSDIGQPAGQDKVAGAIITQIWFSTANNIVISRGSNTQLVLAGTDHWNLAADGITLSEDPTAQLVVTFNGAGSLIVQVEKTYAEGSQDI